MNTIKLRVEAAMMKSGLAHHFYQICVAKRKTYKAAMYWRTLAVVQHDRALNNR